MPDPGRIYQVAEQHRRELLRNERAAASAMVREYGAAWQRIRTQLDALTRQIDDARRAGEEVEASWLFRQNRLQALLNQVQTEIARFVDYAAPEITRQQRDAVEAAQRHVQTEVAILSDDMTTLASFNRLPTEALTDLVGFTETGPLRGLLDKLGPDVSDGFRRAMIESLAIGRNPRETARRVRKEFSVGLSRALRISRTEQLRSYRTATLRNYQANSDIIDGWIWLAAKQGRTCPMCLAMDGTEHSLNETLNDHPQGRCKPIPKIKGHKLPARETGAEWLEKQDEASQRKVLGNAGYEAFKAGKVTLKDFVGQKRSKDWGTTRYAKSLTQILGKDEAAKFKKGEGGKGTVAPAFNGRELSDKEIYNWHKQNYGEWEKSLNASDRDAIWSYTGNGYADINRALRNNDHELLGIYGKDINRLEAMINRTSTPEDLIVFRGGKAIRGPEGKRLTFEQTKELEGKSVPDSGFMSTSMSRDYALKSFTHQVKTGEPGILYEIRVAKGTRAASLASDELSAQVEDELLIQRNSSLKIIKVSSLKTERGIVTHILAEVTQ